MQVTFLISTYGTFYIYKDKIVTLCGNSLILGENKAAFRREGHLMYCDIFGFHMIALSVHNLSYQW